MADAIAEFWRRAGVSEPLILASSSPRRADLLRAVGCPFEVVPPDYDEGSYGPWDGGEHLRSLAVEKAERVRALRRGRTVLAADTVVLVDNRVLGKPADPVEAAAMLSLLSGREHEVWTALCYFPPGGGPARQAAVSTRVTFRALSAGEIAAYVATGEPLDKAGAYGIQGLGGLWISRIEGCYFNVVGLPLSALWDLVQSR
ncbi:MAG: septum formation protein Maf [Candidatus Zixiibacteriota bacterium]|nr:MAG: septum formation protein Maf [candidate division Zixibacteria bacterium]